MMMASPAAVRVVAPRRAIITASSQARQPAVAPVSRRSTAAALLGLVALPLLLTAPAQARDAREAARAATARKEKLKATVKSMSETGKAKNAFATSRYQLPEESTTPNMRTLANDRLRVEE